jgi:hypothetical protein
LSQNVDLTASTLAMTAQSDRPESWIGRNWFRVIIAISLLIVSVGFAAYLYARAEMSRDTERYRRDQARLAREDRLASDKKDFALKRKSSCLDIYKAEGAKWNNVRGWEYDADRDICFIRYKDKTANTMPAAACDKRFSVEFQLTELMACYDGEFVARF